MKNFNRDTNGKETHKGDWIKLVIINALLIFALIFIVGTITNIILALIGYMTSIPITVQYYSESYASFNTRLLWLILAFVSLAACMGADFGLSFGVGGNAAEFRTVQQGRKDIDLPAMFISVALGLVLNAAICIAVALVDFAYLVMASPVQYIARFMGNGKRSIFNDVAFDFPDSVKVGAILVYTLFIGLACILGYIIGHKLRVKHIEKQREYSKGYTKTRVITDAEIRRDEELMRKKDIKRDRLSKRVEEEFIKLNREKQIYTAVFIVLWYAADILLWYLWGKSRGGMLSSSCVPFAVILVLPFYPMKRHEVFVGKSYYAEVREIKSEDIITSDGRRFSTKKVTFMYLKSELDGGTVKLQLNKNEGNYKAGDKVFKLSAFKYPINCSYEDDENIFCPNCGNMNSADTSRGSSIGYKHCKKCHTRLCRK